MKSKYSYQELKALERDLKTNRHIDFLLENVKGLAILGKRVLLGNRIIPVQGYEEVFQYNPSIPKNKGILVNA
jgi:hypothetical protein